MMVGVEDRLKAINQDVPNGIAAAQWEWIKPRLSNWLYARSGMAISEAEYYRHLRYLVAQCPIKGFHAD